MEFLAIMLCYNVFCVLFLLDGELQGSTNSGNLMGKLRRLQKGTYVFFSSFFSFLEKYNSFVSEMSFIYYYYLFITFYFYFFLVEPTVGVMWMVDSLLRSCGHIDE